MKCVRFILMSWVRWCDWLRNSLANFKDRLKALEAKVAEQGLILIEAQVVALEKKAQDDEFNGAIDTAHPEYLGSQGAFKGVGRVCQQTNGICERFHTTNEEPPKSPDR